MSQNLTEIACINGRISLLSEAKISLSDRGFLFGHSLFETFLVEKNEIINWNLHYQRLLNGCKKILISLPNEEKLKEECKKVINVSQRHSLSNKMSLKIIISAGNGFDLSDYHAGQENNVYIICRSIPNSLSNHFENGIKLKSFKDQRSSFLIDVKTCNYLFNFICLYDAKKSDFDDVLFKDHESFYSECATSSLIWFDKSFNVHSYPLGTSVLSGTSLAAFIEKLSQAKIKFSFDKFSEKDMNHNCIGAAAISSVRGFVSVQKIDDIHFDLNKYKDFFIELENILK